MTIDKRRVHARQQTLLFGFLLFLRWAEAATAEAFQPTRASKAQQLMDCYNNHYDSKLQTFEPYLRGIPTSLRLHRVLWSNKPVTGVTVGLGQAGRGLANTTSSAAYPLSSPSSSASSPFSSASATTEDKLHTVPLLTIFSAVTLDRLEGLKAQCMSYSGPLVAALYVPLLVNATAEAAGGQKLAEAGGVAAAAAGATASGAVGAGGGVVGGMGGTAGEQQKQQPDAAVIAGATAGAAVDPDGEKSDLYGGRGASGEDGEEAYEEAAEAEAEAEADRAAGGAGMGAGVGIGAAVGDPILDNLKRRSRQALGMGMGGGVEGSVWASGEVGVVVSGGRRGRRLRQGQLPQARGDQQGQGAQEQGAGVRQAQMSQVRGQGQGVQQPGGQAAQQEQQQQQAGAAPSFPAPEEVSDEGHAVPGGALGPEHVAALEAALRSAREVMQATDADPSACSLRILLLYERIAAPDHAALGPLLPVNTLRNAAHLAATTPLSAMVDVDVSVSRTLSALVTDRDRAERLLRRSAQAPTAFVMPAFETAGLRGDWDKANKITDAVLKLPLERKPIIRTLHAKRLLKPFHITRYPLGHGPTLYARWYRSPEAYSVKYIPGYEPWAIVPRMWSPPYDVRFRGFGYNKIVQVRHMAAMGFSFAVLPDVWLVHRPHAPSSSRIAGRTAGQISPNVIALRQPRVWAGQTMPTHQVHDQLMMVFYSRAKLELKELRYQPATDPQADHCRQVLTWWQRKGSRQQGQEQEQGQGQGQGQGAGSGQFEW